ncbi:metallophosphoesterase family protein [Paenibacillus rigui]|uniref:Calcineurin-like phosphoesterase domain-containing protein n=1 Tax=Paenibacillus rigui TaxID=554312 RepID=A0A229UX23_9BACL|nr:metallophosphoesterase [Paenibacillus rigui]OXM87950.1 hypothetical protein CF651_02280 [Paenibacillus rigui]
MIKARKARTAATARSNGNFYTQSKKLLLQKLRSSSFDPNHYRIVYMGDSWAAEGNNTGVAVLNEALNVTGRTKPLYTLHGGDAVFTGSKEQLNFFVKKVKSKIPSIPLFVSVGNHEATFQNGTSSLTNFKNIIGPKELHFVVRTPFVKVIALSSVSANGGHPYGLSQSELNFLKKELNTNVKNIIITTHVPPSDWEVGRAQFNKLIQKNNVKLLIFSHVHAYRKFKYQGKDAIISGGAGAALDKNQINHILILTVRNGNITTKKVPISWQL